MADLVALPFEVAASKLPPRVEAIAREANMRSQAWIDARLDDPIPGFVPCDFRRVAEGLQEIGRLGLAPGSAFLEWGSGIGGVTLLAAALGFDATGIEVVESLVDSAIEFAEEEEVEAEFFAGSYIPEGLDEVADGAEEFAWIETEIEPAYEEMEVDPDDFDLIFAYPWPGEEQIIQELFLAVGGTGALLLTYNGVEDLRLFRKMRR